MAKHFFIAPVNQSAEEVMLELNLGPVLVGREGHPHEGNTKAQEGKDLRVWESQGTECGQSWPEVKQDVTGVGCSSGRLWKAF